MASLGDNITALAVRGTFDDCQRLVKQAFADDSLRSRVVDTRQLDQSGPSVAAGVLLLRARRPCCGLESTDRVGAER